eukprot:1447875-Pleurochrysis_carterae.AAC.1
MAPAGGAKRQVGRAGKSNRPQVQTQKAETTMVDTRRGDRNKQRRRRLWRLPGTEVHVLQLTLRGSCWAWRFAYYSSHFTFEAFKRLRHGV